ncbi:MAG: hypothetical protein QM708_12205 [Propioniciclava sp.]|uniref:hypothetical protein n=1 Tax=Propioniciclava sp. TaxID=2038686 RepID=UPI0039E52725
MNAAAARKLIAVEDLADALSWSLNPHDVADELWVDISTLEARMTHLNDIEMEYLRRRLAHLIEEN